MSETLISTWLYRLVVFFAFAIPVTISWSGRDAFRIPKELAFRAEGIILLTLVVAGLIFGELRPRTTHWKHPAIVIPIAVVGWSLITTLASRNHALSVPSLAYICAACLVFVVTTMVARHRKLAMIDAVLWCGAINSGLYLVQDFGIWNPFSLLWGSTNLTGHNASTGLLGNANDVGSALLPVAIVAIAAAIVSRKRKTFYVTMTVLICVTLLKTLSVAAIGALMVGVITLGTLWNWKRALPILAAIVFFFGGVTLFYKPLNNRVSYMIKYAREGNLDALASGRVTAFACALQMFRDDPLTGTGPGTYGWLYLPYKLEISARNPDLYLATEAKRFNFEEAHNDHLEVLAETGLPGFALFGGVLLLLGLGSIRRPQSGTIEDEDENARFARLTQLPLAAAIGVVALAQYPFQLTSSTATLLFIVAICSAWRTDFSWGDTQTTWQMRAPSIATATALAIVPLYLACWIPWQCNVFGRQLDDALKAALDGNPAALKFLQDNTSKAEAYRSKVPGDVSLSIALASTYRMSGQLDEAAAVYGKALEYDRRPEMYFNRAGIRLSLGDRVGAYEDFETAARFNTRLVDRIRDPIIRARVLAELKKSYGEHLIK